MTWRGHPARSLDGRISWLGARATFSNPGLHPAARFLHLSARMSRNHRITILAGDGIGPEVMDQAVRVLEAAEAKFNFTVTRTEHLVGGAALRLDVRWQGFPFRAAD